MNPYTVDEKSIKSWLDIAPHYIGFFLAFLKSPATALQNVKGASKISSDLVSIMIGGIALSYFIVLAIKSPALEADQGTVLTLLRKIDRNAMPFVALLTVVLVAVLGHLIAKGVARVIRIRALGPSDFTGPDLGGTVEDSVNAALGFAAIFIPIAVGTIAFASFSSNFWLPVACGLGLSVMALFYLPLALSATHPNTSFVQSFLALGIAVGGILEILDHVG
jgi:hypothetical protein